MFLCSFVPLFICSFVHFNFIDISFQYILGGRKQHRSEREKIGTMAKMTKRRKSRKIRDSHLNRISTAMIALLQIVIVLHYTSFLLEQQKQSIELVHQQDDKPGQAISQSVTTEPIKVASSLPLEPEKRGIVALMGLTEEEIIAEEEVVDEADVAVEESVATEEAEPAVIVEDVVEDVVEEGPQEPPEVTLLISFPNSGTSFTMQASMLLTSMTAGTNYWNEVEHKSNTSIMFPDIENKTGHGPYFLREQEMGMPKHYVLTKAHCTGYSNDDPIEAYLVNETEFAQSCQSTHHVPEGGTDVEIYPYDTRIMPKTAVRLVRDPFDNIVSNFHHWTHNFMQEDDPLGKDFSNDEEGKVKMFQKFCEKYDKIFDEKMEMENIEFFHRAEVKESMKEVPCHQFFFRYVQVSKCDAFEWKRIFLKRRTINKSTLLVSKEFETMTEGA